MKRVQRWRYYCDFCKKAGNSGFHMKNHEARCTLNPARVCRLCERIGDGQADMAEMLALLPDPAQFMLTVPAEYVPGIQAGEWLCIGHERTVLDETGIRAALEPAMKKLRELANNCPVCIMAAIRQKGIPVPVVESFDFKSELDDFWKDENAAREEERGWRYE